MTSINYQLCQILGSISLQNFQIKIPQTILTPEYSEFFFLQAPIDEKLSPLSVALRTMATLALRGDFPQ